MNILLHPTYFPNIASFVALSKADKVYFELDDNFQKQTYRNRAYIYGANGKLLLNIPVIHTQIERQKYKDVIISNDTKWQSLHWKSLESAYRTSPYFEFYEDELKPLFIDNETHIMAFNLKCFKAICECLQLDINLNFTIDYQKEVNDKSDLRNLVNSKKEQNFNFDKYTQVFDSKYGFINNLSILDLLFSLGPESLTYLEKQRL